MSYLADAKRWNEERRERDWAARRLKKRVRDNPQQGLAANLRARLYQAIKHGRTVSAVRDVGCTLAELRVHLESLFQPGMTWENQGEWHVDHVRPLASFDLTDRQQALVACNYRNLQPLWAQDNIRKGARNIGA